jgi:hypothetical protein
MNQFPYRSPRAFSGRKISLDQAIKVLKRNGIRVNRENAEVILDFLYLIAKTYKNQKEHANYEENKPKE